MRAGIRPVPCVVYVVTDIPSVNQAIAEAGSDLATAPEALRQRLSFIPAEAQPGVIFMNTSSAAWRRLSNVDQLRMSGHEYFHVVQMSLLGPGLSARIFTTPPDEDRLEGPSWLFEGSADYMSWRALDDAGLADLDAYLKATPLPDDIALRDLETFIEYYGAGPERAVLPLVAVDLLVQRPGPGSLATFYQLIGRGGSWRAAFSAAFGRSVDAFYAEFDAYLNSR
jgi:hypothetical protein